MTDDKVTLTTHMARAQADMYIEMKGRAEAAEKEVAGWKATYDRQAVLMGKYAREAVDAEAKLTASVPPTTPTSAPVEDVGGLVRAPITSTGFAKPFLWYDFDNVGEVCVPFNNDDERDAILAALIQPQGEERCPKCGGTHPGRYEGACSGSPSPRALDRRRRPAP